MLTALFASVVLASSDGGVDALKLEAAKRTNELIHVGFNFTWGFTLDAGTTSIQVLVPPAGGEQQVVLWAAPREQGTLSARLRAPDGGTVFALESPATEVGWSGSLPQGRSNLEVSSTGPGRGVLAVKGRVLGTCLVQGLQEIAADPSRGFSWPYLLYTPPKVRRPEVLVAPNNPGFVTDSLDLLRAAASCELDRHVRLAVRLGTRLVMPLFPRPPLGESGNLYLHALTRAALEAKEPSWRRVDLQLEAMLEHAGAKRVLLSGFSASGSFAHRFALLHPRRVVAVAAGSPGGWPTAPVPDVDGVVLPWPVGVGDVAALTGAPLDLEALRKVRFFLFRGVDDRNDSVPYRDSFSLEDEKLIKEQFGALPADRWWAAEALHARGGLRARFGRYPGVAHEVSDQMEADLAAFFESALQK